MTGIANFVKTPNKAEIEKHGLEPQGKPWEI